MSSNLESKREIVPAGLGVPESVTEGEDKLHQFITFSVENEEYGVDILAVREIIAWSEVTRLPNTREYVRGVLNLRGSILPVFDLRCRFGMGLTEVSKTHVIIVLYVDGKLIGILADSVSQILHVSDSDFRSVPDVNLIVDQEYLAGLVSAGERMVAILDVNHLFDPAVLRESIEIAQTQA